MVGAARADGFGHLLSAFRGPATQGSKGPFHFLSLGGPTDPGHVRCTQSPFRRCAAGRLAGLLLRPTKRERAVRAAPFTRLAVPLTRLILNADDLGLAAPVNAAIERAHRDGVLTAASLMVGEPAMAEAVDLARRH